MTRWRNRMGEERLTALLQESLSVAVKTGAMKPAEPPRVCRRPFRLSHAAMAGSSSMA
jgi:hypothetical protein